VTDDQRPNAASGDVGDTFRRADAIFDAALDHEPHEREAYVERVCDGDPALRDAVLRLLRAHERSSDFLSHHAADAAPALPASDAPSPDEEDDDRLRERLQRLLGDAYLLESRVARGGMAIVYRARDVRHDRVVAVKVLDPALGAMIDADAGATRFLAEIRTTARLQHPNLLPLFDSGAGDGLLFYVMPFIAGETLRQRMERGSPLPVDEAVHMALGVAGALEYAHSQGIVHRDLKPENILLHAGQPLVADFGIAFAASNAGGSRVTRSGFHLGTPQYMAPEQVSGNREVDAGADVYALGAVTYEMLTGEPPHTAPTAQAVLVKRLSERPTPVGVLRPSVPSHVARAVERALELLPADRFASAQEFAAALAQRSVAAERTSSRIPAAIALGVVVLGIVALAVWPRERDVVEAPLPTSFFVVAPIPDAGVGRSPTLTPDGERLVYPGSADTQRRIFVRRINELNARPLANTEGALSAFVSPDGQWVAFFTLDDRLKKVPVEGGPVTDLGSVFRFMMAHWGVGDRIVMSTLGHRGLVWISAAGGPERQLTQRDVAAGETRHSTPILLHDGSTVVFTAERGRDGPVASDGELAAVRLDPAAEGPAQHSLLGVRAMRPVAMVDGWLLYISSDGTALMAVRFDAARLRVSGEPVMVLDHQHGGIEQATLADNGTLLYTRRRIVNAPVLVDSTGAVRPLLSGLTGDFMNPRISPDGRRLAVQSASSRGADVLTFDLAAPSPMRLTTTGQAIGPTWMADSERVVFLSGESGAMAFWALPADGGAPPTLIAEGAGLFAGDVGGDGSVLLFQRQVQGVWQIWSAQADGSGGLRPVVAEPFHTYMPALSPDGRWLAYTATATSRNEVFVRPFPGPGVPVQVSEEGGAEPAWSRDGRHLHYRGDRRMHAATIATRPSLTVAERRTLFTETFDDDMPMPHRNYDVSADGRFVMIATADGHGVETVVGVGWLNELRARLAQVR
jgi:eukaryotic-like serine/threonine-protein kinase